MTSDANTIASLLERMAAAGFVERKQHEKDRRAYRLVLKPLGLRKYREARGIAVRLQKEILSALPETERESFLLNLEQVSKVCEKAAKR